MTVLQARRDEIVGLAEAHGASNVRVFGSVARGTSEAGSDIDLLVDFEPGRTLVDQVGLWRDLEALLGVRVDVVSARGLTERDDDIRDDALPL
jgi:predicted nucleotidyltransferase